MSATVLVAMEKDRPYPVRIFMLSKTEPVQHDDKTSTEFLCLCSTDLYRIES
jgi:hypothetical protein